MATRWLLSPPGLTGEKGRWAEGLRWPASHGQCGGLVVLRAEGHQAGFSRFVDKSPVSGRRRLKTDGSGRSRVGTGMQGLGAGMEQVGCCRWGAGEGGGMGEAGAGASGLSVHGTVVGHEPSRRAWPARHRRLGSWGGARHEDRVRVRCPGALSPAPSTQKLISTGEGREKSGLLGSHC